MTTLHMETDTVRTLAGQFKQVADAMRSQTQSLNSSVQSIDWTGPSRDEFTMETLSIIRQLEAEVEAGMILAGRVENEVVEWELMESNSVTSFLTWNQQFAVIAAMLLTGEFRLEWDYESKFAAEKVEFKNWWNKLSSWQRQNYLKEQAQIIAKEYGVAGDEIKIEYIDGNGNILGQHNRDTIKIDIDDYQNGSPAEILRTLAHEVRHSIQEGLINKYDGQDNIPGGITQTQINNWKNSLGEHYINPSDDLEKYFTQASESDARMFSTDYLLKYMKEKGWQHATVIMPDPTPIPNNYV